MVDISKYKPHVQEAILAMDLEKNCRERVARGARRFDLEAPPDWRLNMISITDGKVTSHVRVSYDDQNPLGLAFRNVRKYARLDGRVTPGSLSPHFAFAKSPHEMVACGFDTMAHFWGDTVIHPGIDAAFLDAAWAEALLNLEWHAQPELVRRAA